MFLHFSGLPTAASRVVYKTAAPLYRLLQMLRVLVAPPVNQGTGCKEAWQAMQLVGRRDQGRVSADTADRGAPKAVSDSASGIGAAGRRQVRSEAVTPPGPPPLPC